jgi:hypothetical protein
VGYPGIETGIEDDPATAPVEKTGLEPDTVKVRVLVLILGVSKLLTELDVAEVESRDDRVAVRVLKDIDRHSVYV